MRIKSLLFSFCFISFTEFPFQGPLAWYMAHPSSLAKDNMVHPWATWPAACGPPCLPRKISWPAPWLAGLPINPPGRLASRGTSGPCGVSNSGQWRKGAGGWRWVPVCMPKRDIFEGNVRDALKLKRRVQKSPKTGLKQHRWGWGECGLTESFDLW